MEQSKIDPTALRAGVQSEVGQIRAGGSGRAETVWYKVVLGSDKQAIRVAEVADGETFWR